MGQAQPQQPNKSKLIKNLGRVGIGLALTLTATGLGGFWYARYFLNEQLSPLLQAELTKALKRPVQLGKVERVSFTSLRFGRSLVPPTAKEANFLAVEAIEIKVDPFSYLFRRQLALDAIAEQPQIFLKQEVEGGGLKLPDFPPPEPQTGENPFDLKTIIFSDAQITIQSAAKGQLVSLSQIQIDSIWKITDLNNQRLKLNAKGGVVLPNIAAIGSPPNPEQLKKAIETAQANKENHQGNLSFVVDWDLSKGQGNIDVKSQKLQIAPFQGFALSSPVEIQQGTLNTESSISVVIESKSQSPIENTSQNPSQNTPSKTNQKTTQKATQKATINVNGQLNGGAIKLPQSKQLVTDISGQFNFDGNTFTLKDFSASYEFLNANIDGTFNFQKGFNFNFGVAALDLGKVMKSFDFKAPIAIAGEVKLAGKLTGSPEKPAMILNVTTPKAVTFDRVVIDRFLATLELKDANTLQIKKIQAASTGATFTGEGLIRLPQKDKPAEIIFNSNLVGIAEDFANLYGAKLPITIGQISSSLNITGELSNPQVLAQIDASNATYPAKGEVFLADGLATIRNTKVKFPIGEIGLAGTYNVVSGSWKSQLNSNGIPLSAFLLNQKGILQGLINLRSDRGGFALTDIIADATISLPQGLTEIPDAIAANVTWNGKNLLIPSLQVGNYLTANGKIDLAFPSPNAFPTGISALNLDLISRNVNINRLTTLSSFIPNQASGILNFRGNLAGAIDNLKIAGSLQLDNVDLKSLNSTFSKQRIPAPNHGSLNFDGSINGYLNNPKLVGNLRIASLKINQIELDNFTFNGILNGIGNNLQANGNLILAGLRIDKSDKLEFDKRLEGKLNFDGNQGLSIDLRGKRDQIVAQLDNAFRPIDFTVNLGESRAIGQRLDNNPRRLQVEINNIPLALAASLAGQNDVSGKISSKLIVDFTDNPTATGKVTIDQPRLGKLLAEKAIAKVTYANGILDIKDGNLKIRQSELDNEYKFNLTYNPDLDESVSGAVEIIQGRMQDLFATIQWANIADVTQGFTFTKNRASDLQPIEIIKVTGQPLYKQLQYITQLEIRQEQQEIAASTRNFNLPSLNAFQGDLKGKVTFGLNKTKGIRLAFDLIGKKFEYGKFAIDDIKLTGGYFDGVFAIANANFQSAESYGKITKASIRIAPDSNLLRRIREQSGQIELKNFPIESLRPLPFFNSIPFNLTGKVNGNISLTGTNLFDTKIIGNLSLTDGSVNRQLIDFVSVKFDYGSLNINFNSIMNVAGKESAIASGNFNILGFFDVKLDVKNEGIAFVNIFNQPVRWLDGKGSINLRANGTVKDPKIAGKMIVDDAKVKIAGLQGDFTEVQGTIDFTRDRLTSDLTSNFSTGKLSLIGILPISNPKLLQIDTPEYAQALAINADKLKLNVRDISSDNFNTRVIVRGALLAPVLTGDILLGDGRFVIGNDADPNTASNASVNNDNNNLADITFDRLNVKFENMQVTRFPIFNFLGEGTTILNGTLIKPEPEGKINISRGQFNAISTRFRLDRAYENFVEFRPNQGLNPTLNVRVSGAVAEITRAPISSKRPNDLFSPNEVPVSNLGSQSTLRVLASVTGTALVPDIRLSSSPPRSQTEILALVGGGVLQQQSGSDPAAALVNFAGGTVLNFLQDAIGDAFNIAEFNLSPVTTNTEGSSTGRLGLSAEAAIDVSNSFSVALQRVINDSTQPTNFSVRYRISPNILLRGNYNTNNNTGISIEFENRF